MKPSAKKFIKSGLAAIADKFGPHRVTIKRQSQLWILMYHRILPKDDSRFALEEPGMIVTPDTFSMHMQEIKKHFDVVDLAEWVKLKQQGQSLPTRACAVTFDDGWADNHQYALPILKSTKTPATLFVVSEKVGTDFQFWPNIVLALLQNGLGSELERHPLFSKIATSLAAVPKTNMREYAAAYIARLKTFSDQEIFSALDEIQSTKLLAGKLTNALMTWEQLTEMQESGLVTIGSHTCNHKRLSATLSHEQLLHEIKTSQSQLQKRLASPINLFCFPNGDYNHETLELVQDTYSAAVTTKRGIVDANRCKIHELTRIALHEEISNSRQTFGARLSGWL